MNYTSGQGAFADGFHNESACNIMAFSDHARDDIVYTLRESEEHCQILDKMDNGG